nr:helix-turn-helix transcriptional regulator [Chthonobacter rhizosphaerae]
MFALCLRCEQPAGRIAFQTATCKPRRRSPSAILSATLAGQDETLQTVPKPPSSDRVLRRLGVTRAQARVAVMVGSGNIPAEIATMLGVSINTVRTTLKAAYLKLGVNRQTELVRLFSSPRPLLRSIVISSRVKLQPMLQCSVVALIGRKSLPFRSPDHRAIFEKTSGRTGKISSIFQKRPASLAGW